MNIMHFEKGRLFEHSIMCWVVIQSAELQDIDTGINLDSIKLRSMTAEDDDGDSYK